VAPPRADVKKNIDELRRAFTSFGVRVSLLLSDSIPVAFFFQCCAFDVTRVLRHIRVMARRLLTINDNDSMGVDLWILHQTSS